MKKVCDNCIKHFCIIHEGLPEWNKGCRYWVAKGKFVALLRAIRIAVGRGR